VVLVLIDRMVRKVARLFGGFALAGERRLVWNARNVTAGGYFIRLSDMRGKSVVKPIVLVR